MKKNTDLEIVGNKAGGFGKLRHQARLRRILNLWVSQVKNSLCQDVFKFSDCCWMERPYVRCIFLSTATEIFTASRCSPSGTIVAREKMKLVGSNY